MNVQDILPADWRDPFSPQWPRIGIGMDVATTTNKKSNPSAIAVTQQVGLTYYVRLLLRLKTREPAVIRALFGEILNLPHGLRARALCIDATNERFFATDLRTSLAPKVPVSLIVSSETTEYLGEQMTYKNYLGNLLINTAEDGYLAIPPEEWLKKDIRQVRTERGTFTAEVEEDGGHADCFDAIKLSLHALIGAGGPAQAHATGPGHYGVSQPRSGIRHPFARRFDNSTVRTHA